MIIPLPFIVSLLFTITYATDFNYEIDFNRCNKDTVCYIRKSCNPPAGVTAQDKIAKFPTELDYFDGDSSKLPNSCDVVVQIKHFSTKKFLMFIQIDVGTGNTEDLKLEEGIVITQGSTKIVCKDGVVDKENLDPLNIALKGITPTTFESKKMFCSFQISSTDEIIKPFENVAENPQLSFTLGATAQTLTFVEGSDFWRSQKVDCLDLNVLDISTEYTLKEADPFFNTPIECPSGGKLLAKGEDGKEIPLISLQCVVRTKKQWKSAGDDIKFAENEQVAIACIDKKICEMCDDTVPPLPENCLEGMCKAATLGTDNGCKILKCDGEDGNEWSFDGKTSAKSEGPIMCKKSSSDPTKGGWFFKGHGDDTPAEHTKIACAAIRDCIGDQFNFKCPSGLTCEGEPTFDKAIFNFTCEKGYLQKGDGNGVALETVCNRKTGKWSNLDDNANIVCAQEKKESSEGTAPKTGSSGSGPYIGAGIGGVVVLAVVGGVLYYMLIHKKKQDAKKTTKKEEGTSKKSSKKVESKSGGVGSSNEAKKEEKKSDPNKESEKPAAEAPKEAPKDGAEAAKEPPKDAAATPAAAAATPGAPPTPGAAAPATPAAGANNKQEPPTPISNITSGPDSAPAPADATPV